MNSCGGMPRAKVSGRDSPQATRDARSANRIPPMICQNNSLRIFDWTSTVAAVICRL